MLALAFFPLWLRDFATQAKDHATIVYPLVAANSCAVAAYSMGVCEDLHKKQSFFGSELKKPDFDHWFPTIDFHFWVMYGFLARV